MTLREESATTFEIFVHWLYYQHLPNKGLDDDSAILKAFYQDSDEDTGLQLIKLYVFGDKYLVNGLRRDALDLTFHRIAATDGCLPSPGEIECAFDFLLPTDPLCRFLVDAQYDFEVLHETERTEYTNLVFLQAMWERYVESYDCIGRG